MKEKLRIAVIFPKDSEAIFNENLKRTFGGATVQMYLIAKELNKDKDLKIFSLIQNYRTIKFNDINQFNIIKTFNENDGLINKISKFFKEIDKIKPNVIIQHGLTLFSCLLAKYCKKKGIKFVFMFASDIETNGKYQNNSKKCLLFKMLLKNSYLLITQNRYQHKKLKEDHNINSKMIYNGFELKSRITKKNSNYLLWVSRCDKLKRPNLFLELAKLNPKLKFIMICPRSNDSDYFDKIKNKSEEFRNLKFIDYVPFKEIDKYFKLAKIFVNTSYYEGFPQTFIQATMNKIPITSLKVNPNNFLNKYKCGFCANGDFNLMKTQICQLLNNKRLYNKMSKNAYNYAKSNHDIRLNVIKLLELIKNG